MFIYYKENGDIIAKSEIQIIVDGASELKINEDIEPQDYIVVNTKLQKRKESVQTVVINEEPKKIDENIIFLNQTDFKVIKYRDQLDLGISPDMTEDEYKMLLQQRQTARESLQ